MSRTGQPFVAQDPALWPAVASVLPLPWLEEAVLMDLRWWDDQVSVGREARIPGRVELARRWGWTDWKVKQMLRSEAWKEGNFTPTTNGRQRAASAPPADRQRAASPDTVEADESDDFRQRAASAPPARRQPTATRADLHLPTSPPPHQEQGADGVCSGPAPQAEPPSSSARVGGGQHHGAQLAIAVTESPGTVDHDRFDELLQHLRPQEAEALRRAIAAAANPTDTDPLQVLLRHEAREVEAFPGVGSGTVRAVARALRDLGLFFRKPRGARLVALAVECWQAAGGSKADQPGHRGGERCAAAVEAAHAWLVHERHEPADLEDDATRRLLTACMAAYRQGVGEGRSRGPFWHGDGDGDRLAAFLMAQDRVGQLARALDRNGRDWPGHGSQQAGPATPSRAVNEGLRALEILRTRQPGAEASATTPKPWRSAC